MLGIIWCVVFVVGIAGMFIYKKIEPDRKLRGLYIGYVIGILIVATLIFEPWRYL